MLVATTQSSRTGASGAWEKTRSEIEWIVSDCDADLVRALALSVRPLQRAARQRQAHQHKGGSGFRTADENAGRGLHLVPLIGFERSMPAAFAEMAHDGV